MPRYKEIELDEEPETLDFEGLFVELLKEMSLAAGSMADLANESYAFNREKAISKQTIHNWIERKSSPTLRMVQERVFPLARFLLKKDKADRLRTLIERLRDEITMGFDRLLGISITKD